MAHPDNTPVIDTPLGAEPADRAVVITIPSDGEVTLTAQAAEMSAIRLLDAADQSRKPGKRH